MSWLNRLFGKKTAPLEPWSFPHRIDGLADSLALTVFEHEMAALGRSIPCWTFVSDGLLGHGQKELVLTVARARGEHPQGFAHEVAGFVTAVHRVAVRMSVPTFPGSATRQRLDSSRRIV